MLEKENNESVLICLFCTDNHLKNVKTLQSIYKQTYENINLCIINNALYNFQCERYIYNLNVGRPEGVRVVYLYESYEKKSISKYVKEMHDKFDSAYIYIIKGGDYLINSNTLENAITQFKEYEGSKIHIFSYERQGKDTVAINSYNTLKNRDDISWIEYRESMFLYDACILSVVDNDIPSNTGYANSIISYIIEKGYKPIIHKDSLCKIDDDTREFELG